MQPSPIAVAQLAPLSSHGCDFLEKRRKQHNWLTLKLEPTAPPFLQDAIMCQKKEKSIPSLELKRGGGGGVPLNAFPLAVALRTDSPIQPVF